MQRRRGGVFNFGERELFGVRKFLYLEGCRCGLASNF